MRLTESGESLQSGDPVEVTQFGHDLIPMGGYDLSPEGMVLAIQKDVEADTTIAEKANTVKIIFNWFTELNEKVPGER